MTQYIDKAAVVAEIEKRQRMLDLDNPLGRGGMVELQVLKDKIGTLEVKEVDLEEEIYNFWDKNYRKIDCGVKDIKLIGEHFFELGLKTQKGK